MKIRYFYSVYYSVKAEEVYFTREPTEKEIYHLAKLRKWGPIICDPKREFKLSDVIVTKEKFIK